MLAPSVLAGLHATRIPSVLQSLHVSVTARGRAVSVDTETTPCALVGWFIFSCRQPRWLRCQRQCWVLRETIGMSLVLEQSD